MKTLAKYVMSVFALTLGVVFSASAALPTAAGTAFTSLQTDVLALIDLAWPPMIAITVGFIILRMFKRAASSAV